MTREHNMTFKQIVKAAEQMMDGQAPSPETAKRNHILHLIAELGRGLERLEHNLANQLAQRGSLQAAHRAEVPDDLMDAYRHVLRRGE